MTIHCPPYPDSLVKTVYYNLYFKVCLNLRVNPTFFVERWGKKKAPAEKNGGRSGRLYLRRLRRKVGIFRSSFGGWMTKPLEEGFSSRTSRGGFLRSSFF